MKLWSAVPSERIFSSIPSPQMFVGYSPLVFQLCFVRVFFLCLFHTHVLTSFNPHLKLCIAVVREFFKCVQQRLLLLCLSLYREMVSSQRKSVILLQDQGQGECAGILYYDMCY